MYIGGSMCTGIRAAVCIWEISYVYRRLLSIVYRSYHVYITGESI